MIRQLINKLKQRTVLNKTSNEILTQREVNKEIVNPDDAHRNYLEFQKKSADDMIYFPQINAYGVFKYDISKDILTNNRAIWVSEVHRSLSTLYFSIDEKKHENNKAAAFRHLDSFAKELQNEPDTFIEKLFQFLVSTFPINEQFNLVEHLVNPLVLINKLNEYGFLDYMPDFDFRKAEYKHEYVLETVYNIFNGVYSYDQFIEKYLKDVGIIPDKLRKLIDNLQTDKEINDDLIKNFLSSLMFAGSHSTASFLSSWISTLLRQYPNLLKDKDTDIETLHTIADEVLRIYTPVSYVYRTVRQDILYDNKQLKIGDTVIVFVGAANLDADFFENPNEILMNRREQHLAFGLGSYVCLGRFAVYRIAKNIFSCLTEYSDRIQLIDKNDPHAINGAILKKPIINTVFE